MSVKENAERTILRRKLDAENLADRNLNEALKDKNVKEFFVRCKRLIVEIARLEVAGKDSSEKKREYNTSRELLAKALKAIGTSKENMKPHYSCKKCNDTGYVNGKECSCLKKEISLEIIKESGIDVSKMARFDNDYSAFDKSVAPKVKAIYDKMKKFIDSIDTTAIDTILIVGDTGVGKTHLLECMTTYALKKCLHIKYTSAFNFNQDMLKFHCARLEEKEDIMTPYTQSDILFIDDLGSENRINNVTNEYLLSVLSERMQNNRKTVITTNLGLGALQDAYGERIFSRLMHKKQSLKINFEGKDLRVNIKK